MMLGVALDYTERSDVLGAKLEGFSGQFRSVPAFGGEAQQSGALFLPPEFHATIKRALDGVMYPNPAKPDKKARGVAVRFAAEVAMVKKGEGFEWGLKFVNGPESIDPLADLERLVSGKVTSPATAPEKAPEAKAKAKA
jgi:hypothetical protein